MSKLHWSIRPWPNVVFAACGVFNVGVLWAVGFVAPATTLAGALVGVIDGALGYFGRRTTAPDLRNAHTFLQVIQAYQKSPWTRARNLVAFVSLVVLGFIFIPRVPAWKELAIAVLFSTYVAVSFFLKAVFGWTVLGRSKS